MPTREELVSEARKYLGTPFSHQGRDADKLDCGGLALLATRPLGLTAFEFLGYADFPRDGEFDEVLSENSDLLFEKEYPFSFDGSEALPGDLFSFDYGNGEGTRHLAIVTGWENFYYTIIHSHLNYGTVEHALRFPIVKPATKIKGWRLRGIDS